MWNSAGERHTYPQVLCIRLQHNCGPCEDCNTRVLLMVGIIYHKVNEAPEQHDPSPGRREACNYWPEGTRIHQSHQSHPEYPGVSEANWGHC